MSSTKTSPTRVGPYELLERIAVGGGGEVRAARRDGDDRAQLVVKLATGGDAHLVEALRREWDNLFDIPCADLPLPIDWLPAGGDQPPGIVMERRAGAPFDEALRDADEAAVAAAVSRALRALTALHAAGFVHGDLHPGNLLVDARGHVSLLDLGLCQPPGDAPAAGAGLPAFAAPERLAGKGVDPRDDLFSLAATAWTTLTGRPPYDDYPAILPGRHERPPLPAKPSRVLEILAAWLAPVRELRAAAAETALREWQAQGGGRIDGAAELRAVAGRPWRWGRWGEPALPDVGAGRVLWLTGAPGARATRALRAIERSWQGAVSWLPLAGHPQARQAAGGADSADALALGERGGLAIARASERLRDRRAELGAGGLLLVDDFEAHPEPVRAALHAAAADDGLAAIAVAAHAAPRGAPHFELPPVQPSEVAAAAAAITGFEHDLAVCSAVATAVGDDRAAICDLLAGLLRAGTLRAAAGVVTATVRPDALQGAIATLMQGDGAAEPLPEAADARSLLAHLAVAGRATPGLAGDPAPAPEAPEAIRVRGVRRLPGGGWRVASAAARRSLSTRLSDDELADAARLRATWLADAAPAEALRLRVEAARLSDDTPPGAAEVGACCEVLIDSGEPLLAARIGDSWLAAGDDRDTHLVQLALLRADTALGRFDRVDERIASLPAAHRNSPDLAIALADKAFRSGDFPAALASARRAITDDTAPEARARALLLQAYASTWQGELPAASDAVTRCRALGPSAAVADQLGYLEALAAYYSGELDKARAGFESLAGSAAAVRAAAAAGLGLCEHRDGNLEAARAAYDRSRRLAETAGDRGRVLNMTMNVAVLDHEAGDLGRALDGYGRVIAAAERLGNDGALVRSLNNRGNLLTLIGDHGGAAADLDAALRELEAVGNNYLEANACCLLAEIARKSGRHSAADAWITRAVAAMKASRAEAELLEMYAEQVEVRLASGDVPTARDIAARIALEADRLGSVEMAARADWLAVRCELLAGPLDHAREVDDLARRLAAAAEQVPDSKPMLRVAVATDRATIAALRGDFGAAADHAADALARIDRVAATLPAAAAERLRHGAAHGPRLRLLELIRGLRDAAGQTAAAPAAIGGAAAMNAVLALNRRLSGEHDLERLLEVLMDAAVTLTGAERGFLVLDERAAPKTVSDMRRAGEPDLRVAIARNLDRENLRKAALKLSWSVAVAVFENGERVVATDASLDPRFSTQASVHAGALRSILCVPLALRGRCIGVLYVDNRFTSGAFTQDHAGVLEALGAQAAIAIHTARLLAGYQRNKKALEKSKAEVEALNAKLQQQLSTTEGELETARERLAAQRLEIERRSDYGRIKGDSPPLRRLFSLMDRVRKHDFPVVVVGESGTGKELVARAIHFTGARRRGPFVAINCGAVPENLLESELFGHVRGAFTGAVAEREGLFCSADRGTLFLDEVGEMPLSMQVKLLRVLQTGEIQAVGSSKVRTVDVRVLAATHRDLDAMVAENTFREDLLYRLRVVELLVPALRDRLDDLPLLAEHFLAANREAGIGNVQRITPAAMQQMRSYRWPGNIRELETFLKSACLFADGAELDAADVVQLSGRRRRNAALRTTDPGSEGVSGVFATGTLEEIELAVIRDRLERLGGNKSRAAASLGVDRGTLYNKLRKLT